MSSGVSLPHPANPLDQISMPDVLKHGDPTNWTYNGKKVVKASSPKSPPNTKKVYEYYEDEFGDDIEVHYFLYPDGSIGNVKVVV